MRRSSLPIAEPAIRLIWCEDYNQLCGVRVILGGAWLCSHSVRHLKRPRATTDQCGSDITCDDFAPWPTICSIINGGPRPCGDQRILGEASLGTVSVKFWLGDLVIANSPRLATPCTAHL